MATLEITLQRKTEAGWPVVANLHRAGEFLPLRREGLLRLNIQALQILRWQPLKYGFTLGRALFVDDLRDTFVQALAERDFVRVLIAIEDMELRTINWHCLAAPFDSQWLFLAANQKTPFSLAIPSPASAHFPAIGRRDLRTLALVAGTEDLNGDYGLSRFDVPAVINSIRSALGEIQCDILATPEGKNPTLDVLCEYLTATPYTILHITCHGAFNRDTVETILYFPKDKRGSPVTASEFIARLRNLKRLPYFAFLSTCESADPQAENGLGSLAQRLVRELGMPAVLAMTERVSLATAHAITAPFYTQLYQHGEPDRALAESLAGLQGRPDLTVPALLSRLGGRALFSDAAERGLTDQEIEFGLEELAGHLRERAPVLQEQAGTLSRLLRGTLGVDAAELSKPSLVERKEAISRLNSLCLEALDLSFNALCLGQVPPVYDSRSPFRGLESFRTEDSEFFFGREALTKKLVTKINEHPFLAVLGSSGSGKSSLVMAGLIPASGKSYVQLRPGADPISSLQTALENATEDSLLVVDQFEELFTLVRGDDVHREFITRLLKEAEKRGVVITLRADFLGETAAFRALSGQIEAHQVIVPPMNTAELRRAMENQAARVGLRFESDLGQQMLDDVQGEPGAMPLLQHALWLLWQRRHGRWLRAEEYRAFGGVREAIAGTAEDVFLSCTYYKRERLRDIFFRLTRLDDDAATGENRNTRRRVVLHNLIPTGSDPETTFQLVERLAVARLVVKTRDPTSGETEIEVAHEALIRHWKRLQEWLNEDRDHLRVREAVSEEAYRWENSGRDENLLTHRGARLEMAQMLDQNPRYHLNQTERDYLHACLKIKHRGERLRQRILGGLVIGFAVMLIVTIFAGLQWRRAERQSQIAFARQIVAQGVSLYEEEPILGLRLTLEGWMRIPADDVNTQKSASDSIRKLSSGGRLFKFGDDVEQLYPSPDGSMVVIDHVAGPGELRRALDGALIASLTSEVSTVVFSTDPSAAYFVIGYKDVPGEIRHTRDGTLIATLTDNVYYVSFSLDANATFVELSYADAPNELRFTKTGKIIPLTGEINTNSFPGIYFSSDPAMTYFMVYYKASAAPIELRQTSDLKIVPLSDEVKDVVFSSDPAVSFFVVDYKDAKTELRRTADNSLLAILDGEVRELRFSPDPASAYFIIDYYNNIRSELRRTADSSLIEELSGDIYMYRFSPDPAASYILLDYFNAPSELRRTADGSIIHRAENFTGIFLSPDPMATYFVASNVDAPWELRRTVDGSLIQKFAGDVFTVTFSTDPLATNLVVSYKSESAELRHSSDGALIEKLSGIASNVTFSPDPTTSKFVVGYTGREAELRRGTDGSIIALLSRGVQKVTFSPDPLATTFLLHNSDDVTEFRHTSDGSLFAQLSESDYYLLEFSPDPDGAYFLVDKTNGPNELRRTADNALISEVCGKSQGVWYSPNPLRSYFIVCVDTGTGEYHRTSDGALIARLASGVSNVTFNPDPEATYFVVDYYDGRSELWEGHGGQYPLVKFGLGEKSYFFQPESRRLMIKYADGQAYLLDLDWLKNLGGEAGSIPLEELVRLACEGPLSTSLIDKSTVDPYLTGGEPLACY